MTFQFSIPVRTREQGPCLLGAFVNAAPYPPQSSHGQGHFKTELRKQNGPENVAKGIGGGSEERSPRTTENQESESLHAPSLDSRGKTAVSNSNSPREPPWTPSRACVVSQGR